MGQNNWKEVVVGCVQSMVKAGLAKTQGGKKVKEDKTGGGETSY